LAGQLMLRNSMVAQMEGVGLRANSDMVRPQPLLAHTIWTKSSRTVD
jgi:hypothetical protein